MTLIRRLYSVFANRTAIAEAVRYLLASVAALGVDLGVLFGLHQGLKADLTWAALAGFVSGLIFIYVVSIRHIFEYRRLEGAAAVEFSWFWISGIIGALATMWALPAIHAALGLHLLVAKIILSGFVLTFNYVSRKLILFTDWTAH